MRYLAVAVASLVMAGLVLIPASIALADEVDAEASVYPKSVTPGGGTVWFSIQVSMPAEMLPVTILSVTSDVQGDVADAANPEIVSTGCVMPVDWQPDSSFGWAMGWGCGFEVWVEGEPGEVATTIAVTVLLADGTELVVSDVAAVTISTEFGAIHGVLFDSETGALLADVQVGGNCAPCGDVTDALGRFALESLEPGEYRLHAGHTMHQVSDYLYEWYDDAPDPESGSPVAVFPGEITYVEWGLTLGGVLEGTVTDEATSEPLTGVSVESFRVLDDGTREPARFYSWETQADGSYHFGGLAAGNYILCFDDNHRRYEAACWDNAIRLELGQTLTINTSLDTVIDAPSTEGVAGGGGEGDPTILPFTGLQTIDIAVVGILLLASGWIGLRRIFDNRKHLGNREAHRHHQDEQDHGNQTFQHNA